MRRYMPPDDDGPFVWWSFCCVLASFDSGNRDILLQWNIAWNCTSKWLWTRKTPQSHFWWEPRPFQWEPQALIFHWNISQKGWNIASTTAMQRDIPNPVHMQTLQNFYVVCFGQCRFVFVCVFPYPCVVEYVRLCRMTSVIDLSNTNSRLYFSSVTWWDLASDARSFRLMTSYPQGRKPHIQNEQSIRQRDVKTTTIFQTESTQGVWGNLCWQTVNMRTLLI